MKSNNIFYNYLLMIFMVPLVGNNWTETSQCLQLNLISEMLLLYPFGTISFAV